MFAIPAATPVSTPVAPEVETVTTFVFEEENDTGAGPATGFPKASSNRTPTRVVAPTANSCPWLDARISLVGAPPTAVARNSTCGREVFNARAKIDCAPAVEPSVHIVAFA